MQQHSNRSVGQQWPWAHWLLLWVSCPPQLGGTAHNGGSGPHGSAHDKDVRAPFVVLEWNTHGTSFLWFWNFCCWESSDGKFRWLCPNLVKAAQNQESNHRMKALCLSWCYHTLFRQTPRSFFAAMQIETDFLQQDPSVWHSSEHYINCCHKIQQLKVVSDTAECRVSLMENCNSVITN